MLLQQPRMSSLLRGGDPAPGDGEQIMGVVRRLREISGTAGDAVALLSAIGVDAAVWTGQAAEAFGVRRQDLLRRLQTAQSAYAEAADVLARWLPGLHTLQDEAARIVAEAEQLRETAAADNPATVFAALGSPAVPGIAALQQRYDDVARRARIYADRCARDLAGAVHDVRAFEHSTWENITAELVKAGKVLDKVSLGLSIAALLLMPVPVVGQVVGGLALAANGLKLGVDVVLAADGKGEWSTVGWDVVGVGLGGVGRVAGPLARAARAEAKLAGGAQSAARSAFELGRATNPTLRQAGNLSAQNAARFATHADEQAAKAAAGIRETFLPKLENPVQAFKNERNLDAVVRQAEAYNRLPPLQRWVPPGHERLGVIDVTSKTLDAANTAREAGEEVTRWLNSATSNHQGSR